jgi:HTH-type transcriptional regulator/antitoxin HigA
MSKIISKESYIEAEAKMEALLTKANQRGGFAFLSVKENEALAQYTAIVKAYEDVHYPIPLPETLQGLLELKMYEKKLKQKDLAALLNTSNTQLSEIMHHKRKPTLSLLKALNQILGIDGNLLLKLV